MSVLIEDSPRNLAAWISEAVAAGSVQGTVVTPWASPWQSHPGPGKKPAIASRVAEHQSNGVEVWFDPMTHALQMSGVGDFRFYDEYDLWAGARGDLSDPALREEHVGKVFDVQDGLSVPHLGPTILLHSPLSNDSVLALELAREAVRRDANCRLAIAGGPTFWAEGAALDAHIGALDALAPGGWFLTVVRPVSGLPVQATAEEVFGLCRAARALSMDLPVHISHGDLAALPAVAAGATTVGTGWDQRQRVCSYSDYSPRDPDQPGGGWYQRPTLQGLLGLVMGREASILSARDAVLVTRLGGVPAPGPREVFDHHAFVLSALVTALQAEPDLERRYRALKALYDAAAADWPTVQTITGCAAGATEWLAAMAGGLALYARTEGW